MFGGFSFQGNTALAEKHLSEKAEAEQHQRSIVGQDLFGFLRGQIIEPGNAFAGHETAESVDIVANHENSCRLRLEGLPMAGPEDFLKMS